jgi:hypothetical protein
MTLPFASMRILTASLCLLASLVSAQQRDYPVKPVPFTAVHVNDTFWAPRIEINRAVTIPFAFQKEAKKPAHMDNFVRAAKSTARRAVREHQGRRPIRSTIAISTR